MEELKFYLEDSNGNKQEYYMVYTLHSDITGKDYIVYTDGTTNEDGSLELLAGAYDKEAPEIKLESINSDSEWNIVEELLNQKANEVIENDEDE